MAFSFQSNQQILFLDIETVPLVKHYNEMPERMQLLWNKKSAYMTKNEETPESLYSKAGIYAEFGKVICISSGICYYKKGVPYFRIKSIFNLNERDLLLEFVDVLKKIEGKKNWVLCAHNGKEFDFPFLARRLIINGIELPDVLNIAGKKPWETTFIDTLELWKFGDYKHYTSLDLLAEILGVESPKTEIDGSKVSHVFYEDQDYEKIVNYCENDVLTVAQIYMRFNNKMLIDPLNIERIRDLKTFLQNS